MKEILLLVLSATFLEAHIGQGTVFKLYLTIYYSCWEMSSNVNWIKMCLILKFTVFGSRLDIFFYWRTWTMSLEHQKFSAVKKKKKLSFAINIPYRDVTNVSVEAQVANWLTAATQLESAARKENIQWMKDGQALSICGA